MDHRQHHSPHHHRYPHGHSRGHAPGGVGGFESAFCHHSTSWLGDSGRHLEEASTTLALRCLANLSHFRANQVR